MTRPPLVPLAAAALAALLSGSSASAQSDDTDTPSLDDIPHITMVGHAHAEVAPDLATLTFGVDQERPTPVAASDAVAQAATALVATAKAAGIAPADIRTEAVTLTQTFDEQRDAQGHDIGRKPRGFAAGQTITIRLRDLSKAGALAQSLVERGANRFEGIAFSVERPEPIVAKLTGDAVLDARSQAAHAADAAGVKLGRLLQIERPTGSGHPPVFAARLAAAPSGSAVEPGVSTLDASVEATWAIDGT